MKQTGKKMGGKDKDAGSLPNLPPVGSSQGPPPEGFDYVSEFQKRGHFTEGSTPSIPQQHQTNLTEAHKATLTHKKWVLWWLLGTSLLWLGGVFVAFIRLFWSDFEFVEYFPIALVIAGSSAALGVPLLVLYAVFKKDLPIKELLKVIKEAANLAGKGN